MVVSDETWISVDRFPKNKLVPYLSNTFVIIIIDELLDIGRKMSCINISGTIFKRSQKASNIVMMPLFMKTFMPITKNNILGNKLATFERLFLIPFEKALKIFILYIIESTIIIT